MSAKQPEVLELSAFCQTGSGGTPSRSNNSYFEGGTIPWVKSGELKARFVEGAEESITQEALNNSATKLVPNGALLIAMYGATVGEVSELKIDAATNQAICHIIPDASRCDRNYLFHFLAAKKSDLLERRVGGAQPNISQGIIKSLKVPLPPLAEQRRIAAILDKADALRAKRRLAIAKLDQLLQSVFLEMFGDPVTNPKGWPRIPLAELATKIGSGATPTGGDESYQTSGISLIRSLNVHDGEFRWAKLAFIDEQQAHKLRNVVVEAGDVLLNITGASVARVCRTPSEALPARVNQHVSIIRCGSRLSPEYLEYALMSSSMKRKLLGTAESGATRQAITKAEIEKLEVPVPPTESQTNFAQIAKQVSSQKARYDVKNDKTEAMFSSLQHLAFSAGL